MSRKKILAYFSEHGNCALPYCIEAAAENEGRHVMIVGGTHGNEPAGVNAMVAFHRRVQTGDMKLQGGKVSLLLGNPAAYRENRRYIDRDLNRTFSDQEGTTVESRRAAEIEKLMGESGDICSLLDLHSVSMGDFKICVYQKDKDQSLALALSISSIPLHFTYHSEHMPGTLIEAAGKRQICGLIVECGNHLAKQAVDIALDHILLFLVHHQLMDRSIVTPKTMPASITQYESIQSIKAGVNFSWMIPDVKTGTKIAKGQKFAKDDGGYRIAPEDCYLVVPSGVVEPTDTDAGFLGIKNLIDPEGLK